MRPIRLFAATDDVVARLDIDRGGAVATTTALAGRGVMCVAVDPHDPNRVYVGTFDQGVFRTLDGGDTWDAAGDGLPHARVLSIAISPVDRVDGRSAVYAGTEPSALFRSEDDGASWHGFPALGELPSAPSWSFPPRPWTHHVRWIAFHPADPAIIYAGIELGGVMCSRDGGATWEDRKPGSQPDAHAIATHPAAPDRVYEAAGGGVARSDDAGATWRGVDDGMDRHYSWGLAIDAGDPDCWYVSASFGARTAHRTDGRAEAILYRRRDDEPWRALGGPGTGLDQPLPFMPYALLAPRDRPGELVAAMKNGALYLTDDHGESWRRLETGLPAIGAVSEAVIE